MHFTFSIWINATLKLMYGRLLHIRLPLYMIPIGNTARRYILPVILTFFLPSTHLVVRARSCVMQAAKTRCQHVSVIARAVNVALCLAEDTYEILRALTTVETS